MSQQEPSKRNKRAKAKTYTKPGSLSFLANKRQQLLTADEIVQAIDKEKGHLLKLIKGQPRQEYPAAPQSEINGQSIEEQRVENQVQMNSTTHPTNGQSGEHGHI